MKSPENKTTEKLSIPENKSDYLKMVRGRALEALEMGAPWVAISASIGLIKHKFEQQQQGTEEKQMFSKDWVDALDKEGFDLIFKNKDDLTKEAALAWIDKFLIDKK